MTGTTQAERLAKIETLLETVIADLAEVKTDLAAEKRELAALRNKGAGIVIGIALAAGALGIKIGAFFSGAMAIVK